MKDWLSERDSSEGETELASVIMKGLAATSWEATKNRAISIDDQWEKQFAEEMIPVVKGKITGISRGSFCVLDRSRLANHGVNLVEKRPIE